MSTPRSDREDEEITLRLPSGCEFEAALIAKEWNADTSCRALGYANNMAASSFPSTLNGKSRSIGQPSTAGSDLAGIVVSVASGVLASALYDQLKFLLKKLKEQRNSDNTA